MKKGGECRLRQTPHSPPSVLFIFLKARSINFSTFFNQGADYAALRFEFCANLFPSAADE